MAVSNHRNIFSTIPPKIFEDVIADIADKRWNEFARCALMLDDNDIDIIVRDNPYNRIEQKYKMCEKWKQIAGKQASVHLFLSLVDYFKFPRLCVRPTNTWCRNSSLVSTVFYDVISKIADKDFEFFARVLLQVDENDIDEIKRDYVGDRREQKYRMCQRWKDKYDGLCEISFMLYYCDSAQFRQFRSSSALKGRQRSLTLNKLDSAIVKLDQRGSEFIPNDRESSIFRYPRSQSLRQKRIAKSFSAIVMRFSGNRSTLDLTEKEIEFLESSPRRHSCSVLLKNERGYRQRTNTCPAKHEKKVIFY